MSNEKGRTQYRQRLQQRQTVIFGGISIILAVLMLLASAWWTGILPFPLNREFTVAEDTNRDIVPCVDQGATSVPKADITVNVFNSTTRTGLATTVADRLATEGVTVGQSANWRGEAPEHAVVIYTSADAVPAAYTLQQVFPDATVLLDRTSQTQVLDVVLGADFTDVKTPEDLAALQEGQPLTSLPGCEAVDTIGD